MSVCSMLLGAGKAVAKVAAVEGVVEAGKWAISRASEEATTPRSLIRVASLGREAAEAGEGGEIEPLAMYALGAILRAVPSIAIRTEYAHLLLPLQAEDALLRGIKELGLEPILYNGKDLVNGALKEAGLERPTSFLVDNLDRLHQFEQDCLECADERGVLLTAKRVDYVIGSDYEGGILTKVPLVGSLQQLAYKWQLDSHISTADLVRAGADIAVIVTIVATSGAAAPIAGAGEVAAVGAGPAGEVAAVGAGPAGEVAGPAGEVAAQAVGATTETAATTVIETVTSGAKVADGMAAGKAVAQAGADGVEAAVVHGTTTSETATGEALRGIAVGDVPPVEAGEMAKVQAWRTGEGMDLSKGRVTLGDIRQRKEALTPHLRQYAAERATNEPRLSRLCEGYKTKMLEALKEGRPGDIQRVIHQMKKNGAGELGRQAVTDIFRPYFRTVELEKLVTVDGKATRLDIFLGDAKAPIVGWGFQVPKGGSLAIECKAGKDAYLVGEAKHLLFQAEGHKIADAGLTVVTKDIKGLSMAMEQRLRDSLRPKSPVFALLWDKKVLDSALADHVVSAVKRKAGA